VDNNEKKIINSGTRWFSLNFQAYSGLDTRKKILSIIFPNILEFTYPFKERGVENFWSKK